MSHHQSFVRKENLHRVGQQHFLETLWKWEGCEAFTMGVDASDG